ncbi:hypothetical protein [Sinorhizobium sp. BJ1]|uniref:hypothetical protein n=1 Tax=Sinorhizobium sp. BJ1 TaxID=2035455 RepID=UPI000BE9B1C2|nr:hypothetical protein [Sinorhizobium sp. BJ1]PDT86523.1 hypothetical protein CO676_02210 [Sinorhizobium sp. BJ1]
MLALLDNGGQIGAYTYRTLTTGGWEVKRGTMIMAVFGSRGAAEEYCRRKAGQETEATCKLAA